MKPSKTTDLRHLSDAELVQQIEDNQRSLMDMRFSATVGTLEDTAAVKIIRRDLARMKTILKERSAEQTAG